MRITFSSLMVAFLVLSCTPQASAQTSASNTFTTNLSLGARGTQVVALQKILNRDLDTRIASTGPGSPGYETDYFGLLTKAAVVRFQEKYANEVLAPAGLTQGSGYVGFYTRTKLNALSSPTTTAPVTSITTTNASDAIALYPNMSVPVGVNPNTVNLEYEIALVTKVGKEEGVSDEKIQQEIQNIKEIVATTTDLHKAFFASTKTASRTVAPTLSFADEMSNSFGTAFLKTLSSMGLGPVEQAQAATTLAPFGGHIVFVYPCTCTANPPYLNPPAVWRVTLAPPLPPSYATFLDAPIGTQLFASYNSPLEGIYDLGYYTPGTPSCIMYYGTHCSPNVIPGWGTIAPYTGSSPSPSL